MTKAGLKNSEKEIEDFFTILNKKKSKKITVEGKEKLLKHNSAEKIEKEEKAIEKKREPLEGDNCGRGEEHYATVDLFGDY